MRRDWIWFVVAILIAIAAIIYIATHVSTHR